MVTNSPFHGKRLIVIFLAVLILVYVTSSNVLANHRVNGSGTCWQSGAAWANHSTQYYTQDSTIPSTWRPALDAAAASWTNVSTSSFNFYWSQYPPANGNYINQVNLGVGAAVAQATTYSSGNTLSKATLTFNSAKAWSTTGATNAYDVQNVATHELGHWLRLIDIYTTGCGAVTMWYATWHGDTGKRSLTQEDINGLNWQYP